MFSKRFKKMLWICRFLPLIVPLIYLNISLKAQRPNVILIMTDDQGYGDLACHGNPVIQTPNLDELHADSIRLTQPQEHAVAVLRPILHGFGAQLSHRHLRRLRGRFRGRRPRGRRGRRREGGGQDPGQVRGGGYPGQGDGEEAAG